MISERLPPGWLEGPPLLLPDPIALGFVDLDVEFLKSWAFAWRHLAQHHFFGAEPRWARLGPVFGVLLRRYFTVTKRSGKVLSAGWNRSMFLRAAQTTACWCSGI